MNMKNELYIGDSKINRVKIHSDCHEVEMKASRKSFK